MGINFETILVYKNSELLWTFNMEVPSCLDNPYD